MILDATLSYNAIREMQDTRKFLTNASEELELLGTCRHWNASPLRHCVRLFSAKGKRGKDEIRHKFSLSASLPKRYATPLPQLTDKAAELATRAGGHLKKWEQLGNEKQN